MAPFEKQIVNKFAEAGKPEVLKDAQQMRNDKLQKKLETIGVLMKERKLRNLELASKAKAEVDSSLKAEKSDEFSKDGIKKIDKKIYKDRISDYKEAMAKGSDIDVRDYAFEGITDFELNQNLFRGEGGWLDEYNKTEAKDKIPLESFVLEKQYLELEKIRSALATVRVTNSVSKIYVGLESDDKKEEKQKKIKEVDDGVKGFFTANAEEIDDLVRGDKKNSVKNRQSLFKKFKESVFSDIKDTDKENLELIKSLFEDLIGDYLAMLDQKDYVSKLSPEMVAALMEEGLTEDQWEQKLAKKGKELAKKLALDAEKDKQEAVISKGTPVVADFDKIYSGKIIASEKLGEDSKIQFISTGNPGEYIVKFPGETGGEQAVLTVSKITTNGVSKDVFVFKDPFMDSKAIVGEKDFLGQINGLYLDHVMNKSLIRGKDYIGPDLNEVLHDQEMYNLAEQLLFPKKLNKNSLDTKDVLVFKNLLKVLTNKSNNEVGEGSYGNLQAIRIRVSLLKFALTLDGGRKSKTFYNELSKISQEKLNLMSVEDLCKLTGVESTQNYKKS